MKKFNQLFKTMFFALSMALISTSVVAQPTDGRKREGKKEDKKERDDKIEKLKIGYFTTELKLTTEEAEKFWPVYNELDTKIKEVHKENRKLEKQIKDGYDKLTNEEAKKYRNTFFENEEKELALKKEYGDKFSAVIGDKRALKLLSLEHEFRRELLETLREQGPPPPPNQR